MIDVDEAASQLNREGRMFAVGSARSDPRWVLQQYRHIPGERLRWRMSAAGQSRPRAASPL